MYKFPHGMTLYMARTYDSMLYRTATSLNKATSKLVKNLRILCENSRIRLSRDSSQRAPLDRWELNREIQWLRSNSASHLSYVIRRRSGAPHRITGEATVHLEIINQIERLSCKPDYECARINARCGWLYTFSNCNRIKSCDCVGYCARKKCYSRIWSIGH